MRNPGILLVLMLLIGAPAVEAFIPEGAAAPDFSLPDIETGVTFSLSQFEGQVVVINFWAYW